MRFEKETMVMGAGAGVGVIQTVLTKQYVDPQFGPIPYIGTMVPAPWGNWSTLGNIIIGGIFFGLGGFTDIIKNKNYTLNSFLTIYGVTTLVGGIMNGIFYGPALGARARAPAARARLTTTARRALAPFARVAPDTPTGVPTGKILA